MKQLNKSIRRKIHFIVLIFKESLIMPLNYSYRRSKSATHIKPTIPINKQAIESMQVPQYCYLACSFGTDTTPSLRHSVHTYVYNYLVLCSYFYYLLKCGMISISALCRWYNRCSNVMQQQGEVYMRWYTSMFQLWSYVLYSLVHVHGRLCH